MTRTITREPVAVLCRFRRASERDQTVRLRDITGQGCRIEAVPRNLREQDRISIKIENIAYIPAVVRWVQPGVFAGLQFEQVLHPAVFQALLARLRSDQRGAYQSSSWASPPQRTC